MKKNGKVQYTDRISNRKLVFRIENQIHEEEVSAQLAQDMIKILRDRVKVLLDKGFARDRRRALHKLQSKLAQMKKELDYRISNPIGTANFLKWAVRSGVGRKNRVARG